MNTDTNHKYYVYALCIPNGNPFYIGKGSNKRIDSHEALAKGKDNSRKSEIIRGIWNRGLSVDKRILFTTNDSAEAIDVENQWIQFYSKTCNLCNTNHRRKITKAPSINAHNVNTGTIKGRWLLLALKALGENQTSAASKMGKGRGYFTKHLNGSSFLNAESLAELAKTFPTMNMRYVLTGEGLPLL